MDIEPRIPQGNVYRVRLPADAEAEQARQPPPRRDSEPPASVGPRGRVLVVDDDSGVISALRVVLQDNHDVTAAATGREALQLLLREPHFDVVFCDLMMPEVSGIELYEAVRFNQPGVEERIVFMTGGAFTRAATEFLARVPNPRIEKPFDVRTLAALVRAAVARRQATSPTPLPAR